MRTGVVILPDLAWPEAAHRFREAEQRGFATAWTYDHLSWRTSREHPWYAAVPLLAAAATVTGTLRLGTLVASPTFRHPVTLAKEAITLDEISGGRLELGVGAGGTGHDATVLGGGPWSPAERSARFAEFVDLLERLLRHQATSYAGRFYSAVDALTAPGCVQRPRLPLTLAAAGPKAMAVVARHGDGWVTFGPPVETPGEQEWYAGLAAQAAALDAACTAVGRDPASVRRTALIGLTLRRPVASPGAFDDCRGRLAGLGFTDVAVHWPRPEDRERPGPDPTVFDALTV